MQAFFSLETKNFDGEFFRNNFSVFLFFFSNLKKKNQFSENPLPQHFEGISRVHTPAEKSSAFFFTKLLFSKKK